MPKMTHKRALAEIYLVTRILEGIDLRSLSEDLMMAVRIAPESMKPPVQHNLDVVNKCIALVEQSSRLSSSGDNKAAKVAERKVIMAMLRPAIEIIERSMV